MDKTKIISLLTKIHEEILSVSDQTEILNLLEEIKIGSLVQYYLNLEISFDEDDIVIIGLIIKISQEIYNNTNIASPITDEDYDTLYEIFHGITNKNIVGADNPRNKKIAQHRYPDLRGTLDKVHFFSKADRGNDKRKSIEDWIAGVENRLGRSLVSYEKEAVAYPKFDGVSVVFECGPDGTLQRALTRGNTELNEAVDITHLFQNTAFETINNASWETDEYGIKTEIVMSEECFDKYCKKYGAFNTPRSAVTSILNSDTPDMKMLKYLTIIPLRAQNFRTKEIIVHPDADTKYPCVCINISSFNDMKSHFDTIREAVHNIMTIPLDGIVLYFKDESIRNALGRDDHINKYEVAYKFPPERKKTTLLSVEFYMGILGGITPVAKIKPIKMNGNTISSVSLGSIDRFETLYLKEGDEVIVKYDIIPYLYKDDTCQPSTGEYIKIPTHCEYCNEELIKDPILRCVNSDCSSRIIGKIVNYITKIGLSNISIGTVTTLFKAGHLTCIEDLYRLEDHRLSITKLDGFGERSFQNIISGIRSRKSVYDYEILGSIGIPNIGRKIFKKILNIYYIDDLIDICMNGDVKKLTSIYGIKERTANKIIVGVITNVSLIRFLEGELKVKRDMRKYNIKVTFTKVRDPEFEKFLDTKDVLVMDKYSKEVDMVITGGANVESSKVTKARNDGKEVVSINDAYALFGYTPM